MKCSNAYYIGKEIHRALRYGQEIRVIGVCEKSQLAHIGYIGDEPMQWSRSCHVKLSEISQDKPTHNLHWQQELSESLSKTPPAKEKSSEELLNEIRSGIDDRIKAAGGDKDAIIRLSRGGTINPNSLFSSEEERQEFIKSSPFYSPAIPADAPEYQNPAAAHFVTIADFIESGRYRVTRSECVQPEESVNRFILTVEIVESARGDRD